MIDLKLKSAPDGAGYIYGTARITCEIVHVDVLPPLSERSHWLGIRHCDGICPDATLWIVFVDGEEVGRVRALSEVEALMVRL